jgi:hypothetical protein
MFIDSLDYLSNVSDGVVAGVISRVVHVAFYNILPIFICIRDFIYKDDDALLLFAALKEDLGHRRQSGKPWGWNGYKVGSWWGCWLGCTGESLSQACLEFS